MHGACALRGCNSL